MSVLVGVAAASVSVRVVGGGALALVDDSFSLQTYTADRFATAQAIGGVGPYTYALPAGMGHNDLFAIDATTGVLSVPHPFIETGTTKNLTVRITDTGNGDDTADVAATVDLVGTILRWDVTTLSTNPGGLTNWVGNGATSNNAAMDALRARMLSEQTANQDVAFELTIPAGQYDFSARAGMFRGIRRYRLIGAGKEVTGTRLRNTSNSSDWYSAVHFITNFDPYQRTGGSGGAGPEHYGFRIETAQAGSNQVTLLEAVSSNQRIGNAIAVGKRVYIASGTSSAYPGSYPPHPRYFEWPRIESFTGVGVGDTITLDRPLRHTHLADAPEVSSSIAFGRARIVFWDQDYSTQNGTWYPGTECVLIEGIRFLPNPNWSLGSPRLDSEQVMVFGAQYARLEGVHMTSWGPQISEKQVLRNVEIVGESEPDAALWDCTLEDSTVRGDLSGPNAPGKLTILQSTLDSFIKVGMGRLICDNVQFTGWSDGALGYWTLLSMDHLGPTYEVRVTNSAFSSNGGASQFVFGGSPRRDLVVGTHITYLPGPPSKVTAPFPSGNPDSTVWSWLATNMSDGGIGRVSYMQSGTPRWGSIISIRCPGGPNSAVEVEIDWDAGAGSGIVSGTALRFYKVLDLVFQNVTFTGWSNEGAFGGGQAHNCANHQAYVLAGQPVPASVWDVKITP